MSDCSPFTHTASYLSYHLCEVSSSRWQSAGSLDTAASSALDWLRISTLHDRLSGGALDSVFIHSNIQLITQLCTSASVLVLSAAAVSLLLGLCLAKQQPHCEPLYPAAV